jgi:hypothetical protein
MQQRDDLPSKLHRYAFKNWVRSLLRHGEIWGPALGTEHSSDAPNVPAGATYANFFFKSPAFSCRRELFALINVPVANDGESQAVASHEYAEDSPLELEGCRLEND